MMLRLYDFAEFQERVYPAWVKARPSWVPLVEEVLP
jgi:hypothetical protein